MKEVSCKNCEYHWYDYSKALSPGYSGGSPHRCMRNVKEKRNPLGETVISGDEDCFIANADLNCKHFKRKQEWYLRLPSIIKTL